MINQDSPIYQGLKTILSEKEAAVYFALLELGKSTVSRIARSANINRTTGYDILDRLVRLGLASVSGKEPKQEYVAESPDNLEKLLESRIAKSREKLKKAKDLIPQLKSMHNVQERPKVRFYEGTEGLKQVYEDTLTSREPIKAYANVEDMHNALPGYFPEYYKRRTRAGIFIHAVLPANAAGIDRASKDKDEARETALVPADQYFFSPEINIYDNKIMIASWREKLGIIIESNEIAEAMKRIFKLAWTEAKRLDEVIRKDQSISHDSTSP